MIFDVFLGEGNKGVKAMNSAQPSLGILSPYRDSKTKIRPMINRADFCRGEKTRTSDLHVPNVARCQLCYTPIGICDCKGNYWFEYINTKIEIFFTTKNQEPFYWQQTEYEHRSEMPFSPSLPLFVENFYPASEQNTPFCCCRCWMRQLSLFPTGRSVSLGKFPGE